MPISFYALITPLAGGAGGGERPDQGLPGQPPGVNIPTFPAHPIVIPPDAIAPGVPSHPIFIPPIVDIPGFPTPPIVIPPDAIAPGVPSQPIYWPPSPDQGLPGQPPRPDQGLPPSGGPDQGGQRPDNTLPPAGGGGGGGGGAPDNSLPPIQWPELPDPIPDEAEAVVLVKTRGTEADWYFLMDDGSLQPVDSSSAGGSGGSSGGQQQRRKAGQAKK